MKYNKLIASLSLFFGLSAYSVVPALADSHTTESSSISTGNVDVNVSVVNNVNNNEATITDGSDTLLDSTDNSKHGYIQESSIHSVNNISQNNTANVSNNVNINANTGANSIKSSTDKYDYDKDYDHRTSGYKKHGKHDYNNDNHDEVKNRKNYLEGQVEKRRQDMYNRLYKTKTQYRHDDNKVESDYPKFDHDKNSKHDYKMHDGHENKDKHDYNNNMQSYKNYHDYSKDRDMKTHVKYADNKPDNDYHHEYKDDDQHVKDTKDHKTNEKVHDYMNDNPNKHANKGYKDYDHQDHDIADSYKKVGKFTYNKMHDYSNDHEHNKSVIKKQYHKTYSDHKEYNDDRGKSYKTNYDNYNKYSHDKKDYDKDMSFKWSNNYYRVVPAVKNVTYKDCDCNEHSTEYMHDHDNKQVQYIKYKTANSHKPAKYGDDCRYSKRMVYKQDYNKHNYYDGRSQSYYGGSFYRV